MTAVRVFELHRDRDVTGVSGRGHVATGVIFEDGTGVTHWMTGHISTVVWHTGEHSNPPDTMTDAIRDVHQHIDPNTQLPATRIVWREVMPDTAIAIGPL